MSAQRMTVGGKKFVIVEADEYLRLKRRAAIVDRQERGDVAESKRRLARDRRVPLSVLKRKMGL